MRHGRAQGDNRTWERVEAIRRQVRLATGKPASVDSYSGRPPKRTTPAPAGPTFITAGPSMAVITLAEAGRLLGATRLDELIASHELPVLSAGLRLRVVPAGLARSFASQADGQVD